MSRIRKMHVHKQVAEVARAAAGELYETLMHDDLMWATWRKQNPGLSDKMLERVFIEKNWAKCIPFARATLAAMLRGPLDDTHKDHIMEALALDNTLSMGRAGATGMPTVQALASGLQASLTKEVVNGGAN